MNTSETTWGLVAQQYFGMQTGAAKNKTTCSTFWTTANPKNRRISHFFTGVKLVT